MGVMKRLAEMDGRPDEQPHPDDFDVEHWLEQRRAYTRERLDRVAELARWATYRASFAARGSFLSGGPADRPEEPPQD